MTDHGGVAHVQLPQQTGQVRDVAIEGVRLFAHSFLRESESDHVRNDDAPARRLTNLRYRKPHAGLP